VKKGDVVDAGDIIGEIGYTGECYPKGEKGRHLHFQITTKKYSGGVDPYEYLSEVWPQ